MAKGEAGEGASSDMNSGTTFAVSVLRCRKTGDVFFLEAGKDFVDTLISFLLLPVGTILHLLSNVNACVQESPLGGISSIFASVGNMDSALLRIDRKYLLEPMPAAIGTSGATGLLKGLKASKSPSPSEQIFPLLTDVYYRCNNLFCTSLSRNSGTHCDTCRKKGQDSSHETAMRVLRKDDEALKAQIMQALSGPEYEATESPTCQGFVRENITYMVTDSLEIMPSSTIRSIKVLNKLKVATLADLESSDASVDITQVLQLLRLALTSTTCLNEVFGRKGSGDAEEVPHRPDAHHQELE